MPTRTVTGRILRIRRMRGTLSSFLLFVAKFMVVFALLACVFLLSYWLLVLRITLCDNVGELVL